MNIVPFTDADMNALVSLQPDGWPDIGKEFRFYLDHPFCFPVKVIDQGRITGIGVLMAFGSTAWLAHIIVDSQKRNRGLGLYIVKHLLEMAKEKNCRSVSLVATDLGYPVYRKAGFKEQTRYLFFGREQADPLPLKETTHVRRAEPGDENRILKLDRDISGEYRAELIRPFLGTAWVYETRQTIHGYYLPGLREGTILADSEAAGLELMAFKYQDIHKAVLPADNEAGRRFLKAHGFKQVSIARRMVLGDVFSFHPENVYSRIAGNFG